MYYFFKKKQSPPINYKNEFIKELSPPDPEDLVWTTKEGQRIMISEMADSHLQNSHAILMNKIKVWAAMDIELQRRKLQPIEKQFKRLIRPKHWSEWDCYGDGGCFDNPDFTDIPF